MAAFVKVEYGGFYSRVEGKPLTLQTSHTRFSSELLAIVNSFSSRYTLVVKSGVNIFKLSITATIKI